MRERDVRTVEELKKKRDQDKESYPEKAGRFDSEFNKAVKDGRMLTFDRQTPSSLNVENRESWKDAFSPEEWDELFTHLRNAFSDPDSGMFRTHMTRALSSVMSRSGRETAALFVEMQAHFFAENVTLLQDAFDAVVESKKGDFPVDGDRKTQALFLEACASQAIENVFAHEDVQKREFVEFFLFLALNNRNRLELSKKTHNAMSAIVNGKSSQQWYGKEAERAAEKDALTAYLKGKIVLREEDEKQVRALYESLSGKVETRALGLEIAKKSDPRGWVCGDYTDCCMPFTSSKNREYIVREDMSYFLVSKKDTTGEEDIIAQSVLVYCEDETTITVAIDNIEIANRAVQKGESVIVAQAYQQLKQHLIDTYSAQGKRLKIVIGTSYNDDGGLVTGECELERVTAKPLHGDMEYSDWFHHSIEYVYYDSESTEKTQRYYGLSIDSWKHSRLRSFLGETFPDTTARNDQEEHIRRILQKIGKGEDDGEGGMSFPDNYSAIIMRNDRQVGYILAADYLAQEDSEDYVFLEDLFLDPSLSIQEHQEIVRQYFLDRRFDAHEDVDGIRIPSEMTGRFPFLEKMLGEIFPGARTEKMHETTIFHFSKNE